MNMEREFYEKLKLAIAGNQEAIAFVINGYKNGIGVAMDLEKANEWEAKLNPIQTNDMNHDELYRKARQCISENDVEGALAVLKPYVDQDDEEVIVEYESILVHYHLNNFDFCKSKEHLNNDFILTHLGNCYLSGEYCKKDYTMGQFYRIKGQNTEAFAYNEVVIDAYSNSIYYHPDKLLDYLKGASIKYDNRKVEQAYNHFKKLMDKGILSYTIGKQEANFYFNKAEKYLFEGNFAKALENYELAAKEGHAIAYLKIGFAYLAGDIIKFDPLQAYCFMVRASELGCKDASYHAYVLYSRIYGNKIWGNQPRIISPEESKLNLQKSYLYGDERLKDTYEWHIRERDDNDQHMPTEKEYLDEGGIKYQKAVEYQVTTCRDLVRQADYFTQATSCFVQASLHLSVLGLIAKGYLAEKGYYNPSIPLDIISREDRESRKTIMNNRKSVSSYQYKQDLMLATEFYKSAATLGSSYALYRLYCLFQKDAEINNGFVSISYKAHRCLVLSAQMGYEIAIDECGKHNIKI